MDALQRKHKPGFGIPLDASAAGFDIRDLVCCAVESATFEAKTKQLRLKRSVESILPSSLHGDSASICRLLSEFVTSAVQYSNRGEVCLSAALEDESAAEVTVRFSVSDSECDIWPELVGEFFEHTDLAFDLPARSQRGLPSGLANCRSLVDSVGGQILVESKPGEGSRLTLLVSLLKSSAAFTGDVVLH
jgi:signal transduction histidine kinase